MTLPKTRNVFAFCGFDDKRILQRPFFRAWREKFHVGDASDDEILTSVVIYYGDFNVDMCEFDNEKLKDLLTRLEQFQKLIQRHANAMDGRLERYHRSVQSLSRLARVDEMSRVYLIDAARAAGALSLKVKKRWQDSERDLQAVYRRRFGERLQLARKKKNLTRQQLADMCSLSMQQVHYYENGQREPSLTSLKRFARTLEVSVDWLLE